MSYGERPGSDRGEPLSVGVVRFVVLAWAAVEPTKTVERRTVEKREAFLAMVETLLGVVVGPKGSANDTDREDGEQGRCCHSG